MEKNCEFWTEEDLRNMGFKSVGIDVRVSKMAIIKNPNLISIGNHVAIDPFVYLSTETEIGNYVHIAVGTLIIGGPNSKLIMEDYSFTAQNCTLICGSDDYIGEALANPLIPMQYRKITYGTIIFKRFSGIGANVVIMPNVTLEEGTIVGACALVTKSLEPWGIYIGIPAKRVKDRRKDLIERFAKEIDEKK